MWQVVQGWVKKVNVVGVKLYIELFCIQFITYVRNVLTQAKTWPKRD